MTMSYVIRYEYAYGDDARTELHTVDTVDGDTVQRILETMHQTPADLDRMANELRAYGALRHGWATLTLRRESPFTAEYAHRTYVLGR